MTFKRIVFPALFIAAAMVGAITTGCHNTSTVATASPSPVPTCSTCTPIPTATPGGPTPTPSPTPTSYQPLANNDAWSYACNASATASKLVATGPVVNGTQTLADTLTLSVLPTTVTADEANDGLGNTSVYQWVVGNSTTTLSSPGLEFGTNLSTGATSMYDGPVTGTITTTYEGSVGSRDGYNNVVEFKSVNPNPIFAALGEVDTYAVLQTGPIELDFPDNSPALTCIITGPPTINSVGRRP